MSLIYQVDGVSYALSYSELKSEHERLCSLSDKEFLECAKEALHLACIIAYLKEIPTATLLSDRGVIHLLSHQLHIPSDCKHEIVEMREKFQKVLALS